MWVIQYKLSETDPQWKIIQDEDSDEDAALQYAMELLADGFIVQVWEE